MRNVKCLAAAAAALLVLPAAGYGQQEAYLELMRQDIKTQKVAVVTEAMQLSDAQAEAFWPVYRDYHHDRSKVIDRQVALIEDYAAHYGELTDEKAKQLMKDWMSIQSDKLKLKKRYLRKFQQVLPATKVVRYYQAENRLDGLVDVELAKQIPLAW